MYFQRVKKSARVRWDRLLVLVLILLPLSALGQTYSELEQKISKKKKRSQIVALRRFAQNPQIEVSERIKAAAVLQKLLAKPPKQEGKLIAAYLLQARLHGLAAARGKRARSLKRAKALAKKRQDRRESTIQAILEADSALLGVKREVERRGQSPAKPMTDKQRERCTKIKEGYARYRAIGDKAQLAKALYWVARFQMTVQNREQDPLEGLEQAERLMSGQPELAGLYVELLRSRSRYHFAQADWSRAALDALRADHLVALDPKDPYLRTLETMQICHSALQQGISCVDIELKEFSQLSFYDFSREPRSEGFDQQRAAQTLAEYQPLLHRCLQQGAKTDSVRDSRIALEWAIGLDGQVKSVELKPTRLRNTALAKCMQQAFAQFRYRPYSGEMFHTQLNFEVGE